MHTRAGPLSGASTAELVADRLREAIFDGRIAPGAQLHQENLAEQYGVSRSPIREALRLLEARGMVTYYPNRGAVVTTFSAAQIQESVEIRRLLEARLIELVARTIGHSEVDELRLLHARIQSARDAEAWNALHREFHERAYHSAGRPRMLEVVNDNRVRFSDLPDYETVSRELQGRFALCDRDLIEALAGRDSAAAIAATRSHLDALEEVALRRFGNA